MFPCNTILSRLVAKLPGERVLVNVLSGVFSRTDIGDLLGVSVVPVGRQSVLTRSAYVTLMRRNTN